MSALFGFPVDGDFCYRLNGRRRRVNTIGVETLELLLEIYEAFSEGNRISRLLPLRDKIKAIQLQNCRSVLCLVVDRTCDPKMRLLAIWLRGRCGGHSGTAILARFTTSPNFKIRKETARSLRRLKAWPLLEQMAEHDCDERIRRLATPSIPKPHLQRMAEFSKNVQPLHVTSKPTKSWISPRINLSDGKRPKSAAIIRQILRHIKLLVAGN